MERDHRSLSLVMPRLGRDQPAVDAIDTLRLAGDASLRASMRLFSGRGIWRAFPATAPRSSQPRAQS